MNRLLTLVVGMAIPLATHAQAIDGQQPPRIIDTGEHEQWFLDSVDPTVGHAIAQLSDPCPQTRKQAAKLLGQFDLHCHPEIEPALAHALVHDSSKHVRLAAVHSLAKLGAALPCTGEAYRLALADNCLLVRASARAAWNHTPGFGPCPGPGELGTGYRGHSTKLQPFIHRHTRYEPRVRDTRFIPQITTLPGNDSGIRETLPITPPRKYGYFMLPY